METAKKSNTMLKKKETKKVRKPRQSHNHSAEQKCQVVLSIWTEKRKPSEICKDLSINWTILNQWQSRALEGMLQALEPRINLDRGPSLSPKLQQLIAKHRDSQQKQMLKSAGQKLVDRLTHIQEEKKTEKPAS